MSNRRSRNVDQDGNSRRTIPLDLTIEILSRLPAKSLLRFQSVSKLWFSITRSKDFTNSFLTRSKTRPRLLFTFKHFDSKKRFIFSAPEHQKNDKSSSVVARHDMTISGLAYYIRSRPVNGFVCCIRGSSIAVCNPTTRQIVKFPDVKSNGRNIYASLGYDPVEDQYKVLCVMMYKAHDSRHREDNELEHFIFTLGSEQEDWKKIEFNGDPYRGVEAAGVCIDGFIYYGAGNAHTRIARFDVRSEMIEFLHTPGKDITNLHFWTLLNHQGKLGGLVDVPSELRELFKGKRFSSPGEIHTGEVVVVPHWLQSSKPFCVYYYDLIREKFRSAQVKGIADHEFRCLHGIGEHDRGMLCYPGHVENITFL